MVDIALAELAYDDTRPIGSAFWHELDEVEQSRLHNAMRAFAASHSPVDQSGLREAGNKLAAQVRSYSRGMSGTLDLGIALNAWDRAARTALSAMPAQVDQSEWIRREDALRQIEGDGLDWAYIKKPLPLSPPDEWQAGSPYDRGKQDAATAIAAAIRALPSIADRGEG